MSFVSVKWKKVAAHFIAIEQCGSEPPIQHFEKLYEQPEWEVRRHLEEEIPGGPKARRALLEYDTDRWKEGTTELDEAHLGPGNTDTDYHTFLKKKVSSSGLDTYPTVKEFCEALSGVIERGEIDSYDESLARPSPKSVLSPAA